jgi:hypothetical protein
MPRIITHPDMDYDVDRPRVLIRNANWDEETCQKVINALSDKEYDIYLYHDDINDIQWEEGIRAKAKITLDADNFKDRDTAEWLTEFDADFPV